MGEGPLNEINTRKGKNIASVEEVREFLHKYEFDDYQSVDLPHGLRMPGRDWSDRADVIFTHAVKGKTVLDVGCKYGYFCHEAILRGARRVVGIEINSEYATVAKDIVDLWGRDITILCQDLYDIEKAIHYDIVLFLNVLHHIIDPVQAMKRLAGITSEILIVEFCTLIDRQTNMNLLLRTLYKTSFSKLPLIYIGPRKYHRTWYFSRNAFESLFVKQMDLFKKVEFSSSQRKKGRLVAYCWV